jgi:Flp pilus assembly protein TadG
MMGSERGSMSVEVVILTPLLMAFVMLVVACGRYVAVQGDMEGTARDAVRAASLERSPDAARAAAADVVRESLDKDTDCNTPDLSGTFQAGGTITVTLHCTVSYSGLGLIGLPGSVAVHADSSSPLDRYKRFD